MAFSMSDPMDREVAVFSAARRLPAGERAVYLNEACAGDAALRQRVEELLRAGDEAAGFLQDPAPGAQRPADTLASTYHDLALFKQMEEVARHSLNLAR